MSGDDKTDAGQQVKPQTADSAKERSSEEKTAEKAKEHESEKKEDPEEYADPICVCEPEPYWQEVAERLEREREQER